jgi:hypothetical protein
MVGAAPFTRDNCIELTSYNSIALPSGYFRTSFYPQHGMLVGARHANWPCSRVENVDELQFKGDEFQSCDREINLGLNTSQFAWYQPSNNLDPHFARQQLGALVSLPPPRTGVLPSNDTQNQQKTLQMRLQPREPSSAEQSALSTPRCSVSLSSYSSTPGERPACSRTPKSKKISANMQIENGDSRYFHWPEHCLEQRLRSRIDQGPIREESHNVCQLKWGSDKSFDKNSFVPPMHQQSHTTASDKWLGWIQSIAPTWQSALDSSRDGNKHWDQQHDDSSNQKVEEEANGDFRLYGKPGLSMPDRKIVPTEKLRRRAERRKQVHNNSERKRREQLNKGFLDLCRIVPGLDISTHTRKEILFHTADWLEKLLQDNARIEDKLDRLNSGALD